MRIIAPLGILTILLLPAWASGAQHSHDLQPGLLSEVRIGVLYHDFISQVEPGTADANVEFLFTSPDFFKGVWSPRPHLGASRNFAGAPSQAYLGLTWDIELSDTFFLEFGFGGSRHNGELDSNDRNRKNLGCRWLFRESFSLGLRISEQSNVSLMFDHASNAELCSPNDGLDTLGIRWGYKF